MGEVYKELDAQIKRVLHAGLTVTHLDSHQHIHMLPGIFDTHSHIYLDAFDADRDAVLDRAAEAGVTDIALPAIDFISRTSIESMRHSSIRFHRMAGIHPCEIGEVLPDETRLSDWVMQPEVVAVGETGLDYYWSTAYKENQKKSLRMHCRLAKTSGKPIVLHNRESTSDMLDLIETEQDGSLTGVWHCFTGSAEEGQRAMALGLYLGIGGVVTFKNGGIDTFLDQFPIERLLLETDAPYLSPAPHRGKRNEPAYIRLVAEKLADVMGVSLEETIRITHNNALRLFRMPAQTGL